MDPAVAKKINQEFTKYPLREYPKGQILLFAGDNPSYLFYVLQGKIRKYDISSRGDELVVNISKPPIATPLTSLLTNTPTKYFYKTETLVSLHAVPAKTALAFIKSDNQVLWGMLKWAYHSIDSLQGRIVQVVSGNAKSRVIYELANECKNFGQKAIDGSYRLSVSETDLAARSGLSRETVSREISKLKTAGLVSVKSRDIFVSDPAKLEKLL